MLVASKSARISGLCNLWRVSLAVLPSMAMTSTEAYGATKKRRLDGELQLQVKKLSEHAVLPTRGSPQAAGYDLYRYCSLRGVLL